MPERVVAFLRGVNIGGRAVRKERLREAFEAAGLVGVETFRHSGNVVFDKPGEGGGEGALEGRIEAALSRAFGFEVPVFLRRVPSLERLVRQDPFEGFREEGASFLVTFLRSRLSPFPLDLPLTIPKSTARVVSARGSEVFSVTHGGGEGAMPNPFLESKLNTRATTRNLNVVKEIVERFAAH